MNRYVRKASDVMRTLDRRTESSCLKEASDHVAGDGVFVSGSRVFLAEGSEE